MKPDDGGGDDLLNSLGRSFLMVDTRWVIIAILVCVAGFVLLHRVKKKSWLSRTGVIDLTIAVIQLYSAPLLFCMLVLTQPPAFDLASDYERQSAGLLAFLILSAGFISQVKKSWRTGGKKGVRRRPIKKAAPGSSTPVNGSGGGLGS